MSSFWTQAPSWAKQYWQPRQPWMFMRPTLTTSASCPHARASSANALAIISVFAPLRGLPLRMTTLMISPCR